MLNAALSESLPFPLETVQSLELFVALLHTTLPTVSQVDKRDKF